MIKYSLILFLLILLSCNSSRNQNEYSFIDFIEDVDKNYELMESDNFELTIEKAVVFVKIYNTIYYYGLKSENLCSKYLFSFENQFLKQSSDILGCQVSMGMGMYCEDYDLCIGGAIKFHPNSYFVIDGEYFEYLDKRSSQNPTDE